MDFKEKAKNQSKDTVSILKNTFTLFWEDKDLFQPVVRMGVFEAIHLTVLLASVLMFTNAVPGTAYAAPLFLGSLALGIAKYFYITYQKSVLSHGSYQVIQGKDATYQGSKTALKDKLDSILVLSIADYVVTRFINNKKNQENKGIIISIIVWFLGEAWDFLENYLVPAIVIDDIGITEVSAKIKEVKNNVPGALAGVFGIDITTGVVSGFLAPVFFGIILLAGAAAYFLPAITSATLTLGGITLAYVPIILGIYGLFLISSIVRVINESLKATYYTTMYTAIQYPDRISKQKRGALTNYLTLGEDVSPQSTKDQSSTPDLSENETQLADYLSKVATPENKETLLKKAQNKGYTEEEFEHAWNAK